MTEESSTGVAEPVQPRLPAPGVRLSALKSDAQAEVEGRWFEYPEGGRFRIARVGHSKFNEYLRRRQTDVAAANVTRGIRGVRGDFGLTEKQNEDLSVEATARHILLGWEDVLGDDDQPLPYSFEIAQTILTDEASRDLASWILRMAVDGRFFRARAAEAAAKN